MVINAEIKMPSSIGKKRASFEKTHTNSIHHYAMIYPQKFKNKPGKEIGMIHNHFKRNPYPTPYTLKQIVDAFCSGQTLMLAKADLKLKRPSDKDKADALDGRSKEWADLHVMDFKSTQLLGIDIDDEYSETDVQEVIKHFSGRVSAAYYSFSHGRVNDKGGTENRYRLLFQFDKPITDYEIGKEIVRIIRDELLELYTDFSSEKIDIMNPKTLWHGSNRPPVYIDESAFMSTSYYVKKAEEALKGKLEALKNRRKYQSSNFKNQINNPSTYEELKLMCETIGHIPTGSGEDSRQKWLQIVYALKNQVETGLLADHEGLELYNIISGGESTESYWYSINPTGAVTAATIFHHATQSGYKRKHKHGFALQNVTPSTPVESITVKKGIPTELAKELLKRKEHLLIDSPTGSWKTTSFMKAFKELENNDHHYFIFSAPTIPLTLQTSGIHDVMAVHGGISSLEYQLKKAMVAGKRVFVTTYNKTAELVSHLITNEPEATYSLVVDEVHKFTTDYNYRSKEIEELQQLKKSAISFIGLSGTPEDVLKDDYDKIIKINNGGDKSPCTDFRVFTYNKMSDADALLVPVIEGLLKQTKALVFINSKKRARQIADVLRKRGIVVRVVTSETKRNETFKNIIERQFIDESVQVIIATTVIADGISINNDAKWSCLVVTDKSSPIFNPSTIKQISNRFRNLYTYFGIYMLAPNPKNDELKKFQIEAAYQYSNRVVKRYVRYLNKEYEEEQRESFMPSIVENNNGIQLQADPLEIIYNPLFIRHEAMKTKENYYYAFRNAFINEVERVIGHKVSGILNVNEEAESKGADLSGLFDEIEVIKEQERKEADIKREAFSEHFTESIYGCFTRGDEIALKHFKNDVHGDQYAATLLNSNIADFETCKVLGENTKRRADIRKYHNDIQALVDMAAFESTKKRTITKRVFSELKMLDEVMPSKDFKHLTEVVIPKRLKVKPKDVKDTLKMFNRTAKRNENERLTKIVPLTVEIVAKKHGITSDTVKSSVLKYVFCKNKQEQDVLLVAVNKKWAAKYFI